MSPPPKVGSRRIAGYDLARILLGAVLLAASALKAREFVTGRPSTDDLSTSRWFLIGLVEFEFLFGLWLISGLHPKWTRRVAAACCLGFAAVALHRAFSGAASCGCFGELNVKPWYTLVFDLAAAAVLLRCRPAANESPTIKSNPRRAAGILMIACWVGLPLALVMAQRGRDADFVVLEPEAWIGKRLPLLENIDIGADIAVGRWTIVLYRHDCPSCRESIPKYEQLARDLVGQSDAARVALIEVPPYGQLGASLPSRGSPCALGRLDDSKRWFITTPAEIALRDCIVIPRESREAFAP